MWSMLFTIAAMAGDPTPVTLDNRIDALRSEEVASRAQLAAWRHVVDNRDPLAVALAMELPLVEAQLADVIDARRELREVSLIYGDKMPQKLASVRRDTIAQEELRRHLAMVLDAREIEIVVLQHTRLELEAIRDSQLVPEERPPRPRKPREPTPSP